MSFKVKAITMGGSPSDGKFIVATTSEAVRGGLRPVDPYREDCDSVEPPYIEGTFFLELHLDRKQAEQLLSQLQIMLKHAEDGTTGQP
jgi:hypothetical protein